jgi:hypothetical protein
VDIFGEIYIVVFSHGVPTVFPRLLQTCLFVAMNRDSDEIQRAQSNRTKVDDIHHEEPKVPVASSPVDGDISAGWLAGYNGNRPELTDKLSEKVRAKIDTWLLPVCFYIYFCQ